jgi:GR25 family glycosyltransferase involved in LPS biosynthesis
MEENSKCYTFKKNTFTDGLLNDSIDATYVIHLEGNGRLQQIEDQLSKYHPTNIVYLALNKGYKKCNKSLLSQKSSHDLVDAFLQIYLHAKEMNYNNILILEDDFIFSPDIQKSSVRNYLNKYLNTKINTDFLYFLGCVPIIVTPYDTLSLRVHASVATHATVYSKSFRERMLNTNFKHFPIYDWDAILSIQELYMFNKYAYYKPLCYQLFPNTENKSTWSNFITDFIINILKLDKQHEPGTSILYFLSKLFSFFIIIAIIFFITKFLMKLKAYSINKYIKKIFSRN